MRGLAQIRLAHRPALSSASLAPSATARASPARELSLRMRHRPAITLGAVALALVAVAALVLLLGASRTTTAQAPAGQAPAPLAPSAPAWLVPPTAISIAGPGSPQGTPLSQPASKAQEQQALDAYEKLPLRFVENAGQTHERVRYYAQGAGYGFYFTKKEAVLSLQKGKRRGVALEIGRA